MNYITEYNNLIQAGKIVVSRRVKQVYSRLAAATAETSGQYVFDESRASRPIAFIERFCRHSKGEWAGRAFRLELFQKAYIQALFGFIDRDRRLAGSTGKVSSLWGVKTANQPCLRGLPCIC
jgi:phage terminase large subunit-like protein